MKTILNALLAAGVLCASALLPPAASASPATGTGDSEEVATLVEKLNDDSARFSDKTKACAALVPFGPKAKAAVPALLKLVQDTRSSMEVTGYTKVRRLNGDLFTVWVNEASAWRDDVLEMRRAAVSALKAIRADTAGRTRRRRLK
jgi:hypothetical protein